MSKHNLLIKKIKKQILSVNDLIESNFNKLKYFKSNFKKIIFNRENRVILGAGIVVILTLSYLLIPTFYSKNIIQAQIKNQILKNYNIDVKFNEKINYGLLPKPHFSAKNLSILRNNKEIAETKNLKVFINLGHFFSINKIKMNNLVFYKTDFKIYFDDFFFFKDLLETAPNENKILFKNSNIFFKNQDDEVLFINKINKSQFYYDSNNLQNVLTMKSEVFKIPFKLTIKNDKFYKKFFIKYNSKKIRLNIENVTNYEDKKKTGSLDILFINKNTSLNYDLDQKSLNFISEDNPNTYKGTVDFKPFHFSTYLNYDGISTKNIFDNNSIFVDLFESEMLLNKNLSANLDLNVKDITNINELNNLNLKMMIEEGDIKFSDSFMMWKDDLKIKLNEGQLVLNDEGINMIGTFIFDFKDINDFYSSFQIKKIYRKNIKQIEINFLYNFNSKSFRFDNPRINNIQDMNLDQFLNDFNSKNERVFNKITFKNFVSDFFQAYEG
tara:strand:- start:601 stop:2091 length:1491 start_codon:yes stop_codon:yes gene_type:complete